MTALPGTDKAESGYLPTYLRLAAELGPTAVTAVCELGVAQGGSLALWRTLFPYATVIGVDNDPQAKAPNGAIALVRDQADPGLPQALRQTLHAASNNRGAFDLIIDDASHDGARTQQSLALLWPLVSPNGYYVIEDWGVGFPAYDAAGYDTSMLDLARDLVSALDFDPAPPFQAPHKPDSITYREGMILLRKTP